MVNYFKTAFSAYTKASGHFSTLLTNEDAGKATVCPTATSVKRGRIKSRCLLRNEFKEHSHHSFHIISVKWAGSLLFVPFYIGEK